MGVENESQLQRDIKDKKLTLKTSSSSFRLSEVTSFVYGPFVSRFWMLRKHTNLMERKCLS